MDSDFNEIADTTMADETIYGDSISFYVVEYGRKEGLVKFR
jgi:hypothetical protein